MPLRNSRRIESVSALQKRRNRSIWTVTHKLALVAIAAGMACIELSSSSRADDKPLSTEKPAGVGLIVRAFHNRDDLSDDFAQMIAVDPESGECRRVYSVSALGHMSPDGRHIVYWKRSGEDAKEPLGIYVQDTEGDAPPRLILDRQGDPCWSHTGQKVVVSVEVGERKYETWRVNVDGSAPTKLPVPDTDLVLDCSDDGNWLAARTLGGEPDHRGRLTLFRPDGTDYRALTEGSAAGDRFVIPSISPDAHQVAYVDVTTKEAIRTSRLYIVNVDGKNRREIHVPFEPHTTALVRWAPDGKRLAVNAIRHVTRTSSIGVLDIGSQTFRKLAVVVPAPPPLATPEDASKAQHRGQPNIEKWFLNILDWR
jgi:hypothetical protein